MRSIYLSSIGYVHGEPRRLADLDEETFIDLAALGDEVTNYRASDLDIWQLAVAAAARTLADSAHSPNLLVYVSENDSDSTGSLALIADSLDLTAIEYMSFSGHDCGNLGPSLRVAGDALHSGRCDRVLLLLADRALARRRVMASGLSVFSDGAASCMVTQEVPESESSQFRVDSIATRTAVQLDLADAADKGILSTVRLAKSSVADLMKDTGRQQADFEHVLFSNYRVTSQRFLTTAIGFPQNKLLPGPVADLAHCFSADILVTSDRYFAAGTLKPGQRFLASVAGPYSWSTIAIECL